jgi:hypothetical protein
MTTTTPENTRERPHPVGSTSVDHRHDTASEPGRYFTDKKWTIIGDGRDETEVLIDGTQHGDSSAEASITLIDNVRECLCDMTSGQARVVSH